MKESHYTHTHTHTKVHCRVDGKILFNTLLHTRYHNSLHIYIDGSRLPPPPSVGTVIYTLLHSTATAWRLPTSASILTADLFAVREGLRFAITLTPLCSITLLSSYQTSSQPSDSSSVTASEHITPSASQLSSPLSSSGFTIHLLASPLTRGRHGQHQ